MRESEKKMSPLFVTPWARSEGVSRRARLWLTHCAGNNWRNRCMCDMRFTEILVCLFTLASGGRTKAMCRFRCAKMDRAITPRTSPYIFVSNCACIAHICGTSRTLTASAHTWHLSTTINVEKLKKLNWVIHLFIYLKCCLYRIPSEIAIHGRDFLPFCV